MCNYPQLLPRIMIDVIISYIKQKTTGKIITVNFDKSKQVGRQKMSLGNNKIKSYQITKWCQELLRVQVPENGFYIDATTGNGHDTLFLCGLAKEQGHVLGFDIQQQALDHTREMLVRNQMEDRVELICDSHVNMGQYAEKESADAICFNFGYLPGGDHALATMPGTSLEAIREGLKLLKKGGVMSLCIYSGGDSGFEERDVILSFLRDLDDQRYIVIVNQYFNRKNNPPIPAFIIKK